MRRVPELLAEAESRCRAMLVPFTIQRRAVFAALAARADHPTAEELFRDVQDRVPGLSKATAYRTLDKLVELGLVRRVSHPGAAARFDAKTHRHHHLVCERCGSITDLELGALDAVPVNDLSAAQLSEAGFALRDFSILLHGLCRACARREPATDCIQPEGTV